jgi:hypothetical protein
MKPGISRDRNRSAVAEVSRTPQKLRRNGISPSVCGIPGSRKNESRMTITQPTRSNACTMPRRPPMISSATVARLNRDCLW